jgi:trehalose synthase
MKCLEDYRKIVGEEVICQIHRKAHPLYGKHVVHINSTYQAGGVAEMLSGLIPLMNDIGIDTGWRILHGYPDFFSITKKFHNGLQGQKINLSEMKMDLYQSTNEVFALYTHIDHDCVIIHDPQPLPLIKFYNKRQPWIWRCHVDLSTPDDELWDFLKYFILRYDSVVISSEIYKKKELPVDQRIIHPIIDPLSAKNMELCQEDVDKYLEKFNIPTDKPIITQISRFDKWKDPVGVVEIFKLVKKEIDCRLVLCGSMASDDPEGWTIYEDVVAHADSLIDDKELILITSENNILVNALQRTAGVVLQKSTREGFALTVSEALWKETPVIGANVGGIPLQIQDGYNGYLVDPKDYEGTAQRVIQILKDPKLAKKLGKNGRETVRRKFLVTRLLSDWLDVLNDMIGCPQKK